ncbi:hypothetical protein [Rhizobium sp. Leaf384]|uniref:hypothetical protein n=1 Tax=Rhizobium sp. Leaf384 TaxID=1736358 RepID=UPI0012E78047|nr:hypothetical protein [Rhizobium sp. Leaf384]
MNYRIDVFHRGINLASSVMAEADLRRLLDMGGYLQISTFENWVELITTSSEKHQFSLDRKGTVVYYVSAVDVEPTHDTQTVH